MKSPLDENRDGDDADFAQSPVVSNGSGKINIKTSDTNSAKSFHGIINKIHLANLKCPKMAQKSAEKISWPIHQSANIHCATF